MKTIALLIIPLIPLISGYYDGQFKLNKTVNHWIGYVKNALPIGLIYFGEFYDMRNIYALLLMWIPLKAFGYTRGQKLPYKFYIGNTEGIDKLMRKIGLFREQKSNALLFILFALMIFFGLGINFLSLI